MNYDAKQANNAPRLPKSDGPAICRPADLPVPGRKYPSGIYKVGEMVQYTNRGVGMARLPVRINCPPEITVFVLESMTA